MANKNFKVKNGLDVGDNINVAGDINVTGQILDSGGNPVTGGTDLTAVDSNIVPNTSSTYDVGSGTTRFRSAYFANDIYIGNTLYMGANNDDILKYDTALNSVILKNPASANIVKINSSGVLIATNIDATNTIYADRYASHSGASTAPLFINGIDANNKAINNVANPVNAQDAATKSYVDSNVPTGVELQSNKNQANGYAGLDANSKLDPTQLPPLAITSTYVVADETAQLALTVQEGDVAVRSDLNKSYIALNGNNASMTDWQELLTPTDAVLSVAGKTGVVTLSSSDLTDGSTLIKNSGAQTISGSLNLSGDLTTDTNVHATSYFAYAPSYNQHAFTAHPNGQTGYVDGNPSFYIKSAAQGVWSLGLWDGNDNGGGKIVISPNAEFSSRVTLTNNNDVNLTGVSGALIVGGDGTGQHIAIDGNEIMAKSNATTADTLNLQQEGGQVVIGGGTAAHLTVNGNSTFTGDVKLTNSAPSMFFDVAGHDGLGHKRITCNDGGGNFNIRADNYYGSSAERYQYTNSGATHIRMDTESVHGNIELRVADTATSKSLVAGDPIDWDTRLRIDSSGVRVTKGSKNSGNLRPATGNYGSIEVDGSGKSGWEGYSIGGRAVFMHDNSITAGLYNDVNNQWMVKGTFNAATEVMYAGYAKIITASRGADILGNNTDATQCVAYTGFRTSNSAARLGYIGFGSSSNVDMYLQTDYSSRLVRINTKNSAGTTMLNAAFGGSTPYVRLYYNNSQKFVTSSGGISVTGTGTATVDWVVSSDIRKKDNREVITDALGKVKLMSGYTYTRNDIEDTTRRHAGVIAQEVQAVLPEAVTEDDEGYLTVSHGGVNALLVQALNDLREIVEKQGAEIESLKAQLAQLSK